MIRNNLKQAVQEFIEKNNLFGREDRLLLAVSGGIDSMVLWHILKSLDYKVAVVHCNFQLRGSESDEDERFVKEKAIIENCTLHVTHFETATYAERNGLTIQEAARKLRYDYFYSLCDEFGYTHIITAHHADDSIETFFINLLRGTGLKGLTGIPVKNEKVVRPLLFAHRELIKKYATSQQIEWREDSSNLKDDYLRNKVRHKLIPQLLQLKPEFYPVMQATIERLLLENQILEMALKQNLFVYFVQQETSTVIDFKKILANEYLRILFSYFLQKKGFTLRQIKSIFTGMQVGKRVHTDTDELFIDREYWILQPIQNKDQQEQFYLIEKDETELEVHFKMNFLVLEKSDIEVIPTQKTIACLDFNLLSFPLVLRKWKNGDTFYPLGMKQQKKVSDFLTDSKIPSSERKNVWVITSNEEIVWVVGHRIDERFKITEQTSKIYQMQIVYSCLCS